MKQKNICVLGVAYINEPFLEEKDNVAIHEMAFDEINIKKLAESPGYKSVLYYDALKYVH